MPASSTRRGSNPSIRGQVGAASIYSPVATHVHVQTETAEATNWLKLAGITTAERDALTASNGMLIYNSTTNKFQGYENGAWANLI